MKKIIGLLIVCALFGMIFMGCQNAANGSDPAGGSDTPGGNDTTKFEGKWKASMAGYEIYATYKGNSFEMTMGGSQDGWVANKGTITFTDTEMTVTTTHESPDAATYSTEADAIAAMTEISKSPYSVGYTLDTTKTPNTLAIVGEGTGNPVYEKQNTKGGSDTTKFEGRWKSSDERVEISMSFKGNSVVFINMGVGEGGVASWYAHKGTFTFTNTEIIMTPTHKSPLGDEANPITYSTEALAIAAMIAVSSQEPLIASYTLNTAVTPNTLTIAEMGKIVLIKQ